MSKEEEYISTEAILEVSISKGSTSTLAKALDKNTKLPKLTLGEVEEGYVTLEKAKVLLGIAHLAYTRRLVKDNKLEGIKVAIPGGSRWLVTKESIEGYSTRRVRSRELRNYTLRIPSEREGEVRKLLESKNIPYTLEVSYVAKPKKPVKGETLWATIVGKLE